MRDDTEGITQVYMIADIAGCVLHEDNADPGPGIVNEVCR
jgi:hypothetical protein